MNLMDGATGHGWCSAALSIVLALSGCAHKNHLEPSATGCGQIRDAGGRVAAYCCGTEHENPGVTCIDLSQDGGEYGIYGHCIENGSSFEGKVAPALCCDGLVPMRPVIVSAGATFPGLLPDCAPDFEHFGPSDLVCLPCGNTICDATENRCSCPEDCDQGQDAGR